MKRYCLVFLSVLVVNLLLLPSSIAGEVVDGVYYSDEALEKRKLLFDLQEVINNPPQEEEESEPFTGYGRVVDQYGIPVVNARVEAQWWRNEIIKGIGIKTHTDEEWFNTDQNGYFTVITPNGEIPSINSVEAKGYEYSWKLGLYNQDGNNQENMMENSEADPIILYMRKLNPTTFLLKSETGYSFNETVTHLRYTLNQGLLRKIDPDLSKLTTPEQNDLIFIVTNDGNDHFTMHIQPVPGINGSMQVLDDYLYEAPAEGYKPDVTLTIGSEDGEVRKYLYFTSRKSPVYSRMTMVIRIKDNGELAFGSTTWTNPYGKRNLEWEPELPNKLRHKLRKEAEKAIKSGKLAEEPEDLAKLMEQYL